MSDFAIDNVTDLSVTLDAHEIVAMITLANYGFAQLVQNEEMYSSLEGDLEEAARSGVKKLNDVLAPFTPEIPEPDVSDEQVEAILRAILGNEYDEIVAGIKDERPIPNF